MGRGAILMKNYIYVLSWFDFFFIVTKNTIEWFLWGDGGINQIERKSLANKWILSYPKFDFYWCFKHCLCQGIKCENPETSSSWSIHVLEHVSRIFKFSGIKIFENGVIQFNRKGYIKVILSVLKFLAQLVKMIVGTKVVKNFVYSAYSENLFDILR